MRVLRGVVYMTKMLEDFSGCCQESFLLLLDACVHAVVFGPELKIINVL